MKFLGTPCTKNRYYLQLLIHSDRDALTLDLLDPLLGAPLRLIRLVVLVECATDEIVPADRLRIFVFVTGSRPSAHDRSALLLEARCELVHGVAVVVRVARLVTHAEDRHFLAAQIQPGQVTVQELVPSRAAALGVSAGVPRRRSTDEAVARLEFFHVHVADVDRRKAV